jgi:uncharacterized surface protein with fasciclin (FAS1) repeats
MSVFKKITLLVLSLFFVVACDDDNSNQVDFSITGIAKENAQLSSLVAALAKVGLDETLSKSGTYTVFAPTNTAFTNFLRAKGFANLEAVPNDVLEQILLNHVLATSVQSNAVSTGYVKTLAKGSASSTNTLSMFLKKTGAEVRINGVSNVTAFDVLANNGVIHVVDAVIDLPTVVTHATANSDTFSSLVGALTGSGQPDFVGVLSGTGPFTVFAPTNTAFSNLNTELQPGGIAGVSTANLTKVLQYHVVSGANVLSNTLQNNQVVGTLLEQNFTINLSPARITDFNARVSNIIVVDVQCSNGVIHVLDKVLLPNLN